MDIEKELKKLLCDKKNLDITNLTKQTEDDLDEEVHKIIVDIEMTLNEQVLQLLVETFNYYHDVLASENTPAYDINAFYGNHIDTDEMIELLINYWK